MLKPVRSPADLCVAEETIEQCGSADAGYKPQRHASNLQPEEKRHEVTDECGAQDVLPICHHDAEPDHCQVNVWSYSSSFHKSSYCRGTESAVAGLPSFRNG